MGDISFIQNLYKPLQPVSSSGDASLASYSEYHPGFNLQPYIYCFWELTVNQKGLLETDVCYSIVADGCVDLIFPLHAEGDILISVSGTSADKFIFHEQVHYMGIRFFPTTIHYFFDLSLFQLKATTTEFMTVVKSNIKELYSKMIETESIESRISLLELYLKECLNRRNFILDNRLAQSISTILTTAGNAAINSEVAEYISPRQQRRLFEQYVGLSPKDLSKIIRFQRSMNALIQIPPRHRKSVFYEFGYYDQSHFIRDFKQMFGDTPKNLFFGDQ